MCKEETNSIPPKWNLNYYFDDGTITFLVEGELFRIHRHFLVRESVVFRDMLKLPCSEGRTDDNPIILDGIKSVDFSRLLWIFYNPTYTTEYSASAAEWISILTLADMWRFEAIRSLSITKLGDMTLDPVEKMELCRRFELDHTWASDAYEALCARSEPLALSDAKRIGMENLVLITQAREKQLKTKMEERILRGGKHMGLSCGICKLEIRGVGHKCKVCWFPMIWCSWCFENYRDRYPHCDDHKFGIFRDPFELNA